MDLTSIIYSTLAIVAILIFAIFIISYIGYKMKQKEEPYQNTSMLPYQRYRMEVYGPGKSDYR